MIFISDIMLDGDLTISKKRMVFYSLFLAVGFSSIFYISRLLILNFEALIVYGDFFSGIHNFISFLVFFIGGVFLILAFFSFLESKKHSKIIGLIGCLLYLSCPIFEIIAYTNYYSPFASSDRFIQTLLDFVPSIGLIVITLKYWKGLP